MIKTKFVSVSILGLAVVLYGVGCTKSATEPANTIHGYYLAKIKGLDPAFSDDLYSGTELSKVYEGLLQYHYLKRPMTLIPNLAESMPTVSADGSTYTIKIKKGVLFQDDPAFKENGGKGRELTAEDFIYSWKRVADPKTVSPGWWIFDGKIVGLNEWRDEASKTGAADYSKAVEGLKSVDRYTIQIKLVKRSAQFLFNLAQQFSFAVPKEAVDHYGKEFQNHAVGTGPFKLVEFNPHSKIIWVRNPTFRKEFYPSEGEAGDREAGLLEDAGKPIPFADRIVMQIIEEAQPRWLNFMAGKLDYVEIPKDNYDSVVTATKELKPEFKEKNIRLVKEAGLDITHTSFNMYDPLLGKNKLLRQALSLAFDQEAFNKIFYNGRAIAAQGPIPPGLSGYDENFKNPYRQFNLAKAKELLAKAGYPEGKGLPVIEFATMSDSTYRQMSEFEQKSFEALGVKLKINHYSWPEFQKVVKNRKGQMWSFAWNADYPDAENFLQLFYSKNVSPGSNDSNYSNPEYDRLYEKSLLLTESPERTALYKQMVQLLVEDCPWIFGAHRLAFTLVQSRLKNFKINSMDLGRIKYYRVETPVPQK